MSDGEDNITEMTSVPNPSYLQPESGGRQRSVSQVAAPRPNDTRGTLIGDSRWRTMSFSEPGRVVLVAVDPSENSKFAFEYYMRNVHRPDDLIVLTHVPEPPKLPSFSFKGGLNVPSDKWGKILEEANAKTTKLESDYEDMCIHRKLHYKVRGESSKNAGDSICRIADEEGADLIIIGCRGLGRVKRSVMGSVSDYVVRNAQRPVFVIPRHE